MNVLGSIRLSTLIHLGAVETLITILICYAVAVTHGHVKPWLPMISDCAVYPPEKYPFRFGLALSSFLIGAQTVAVHLAKSYSKVSLYLGLLASLGLGIVSVVNEEENSSVHGAAAVVFFVAYWFYMVLTTWISPTINLIRHWYQHKSNRCTTITAEYEDLDLETGHHQSLLQTMWAQFSWGLAFRQLLTAVCGIDLILFIIMSTNWGKYKLYIAICEWFGTLCIIVFNWSLGSDLNNSLQLAEVKVDQ